MPRDGHVALVVGILSYPSRSALARRHALRSWHAHVRSDSVLLYFV